MLIFAIVLLIAFLTVVIILRVLTSANERMKVDDAVYRFAHEAENPAGETPDLTYTGPHDIGTALIGVGFTASANDGSARLSIILNADRNRWWVLYEEFKADEASGKMVRAKRHEAEFHVNTKTATCLETLQKAVADKFPSPAPLEPMADPSETPPNDDPPVAA